MEHGPGGGSGDEKRGAGGIGTTGPRVRVCVARTKKEVSYHELVFADVHMVSMSWLLFQARTTVVRSVSRISMHEGRNGGWAGRGRAALCVRWFCGGQGESLRCSK